MGYNAGMASNPHPQLHILPRPEAPHAVAAERALLGALLYNNDLWDELDGRITAEDFYDKRHQIIFAAVQKLVADSRADAVLLAQTLKAADKLRDAGGEEYVYDIENISAAVVNVSAYADEIKKTAVLRKMHAVFQSANARVLHPGGSTSQEILDETEALLGDIAAQADSGGAGGFISAADKAAEFFQYLSDIVNRGEFDRLLGLQAGYPRLDQMTTGLHGGDLIVVAARPGGGKTAFALNIIRHVSASGAGVAVFSLEMSDRQLVMRLMSQDRIDMQKMRTGKDRRGRPMSPDDWRALGDAEGNLRGRHIFIDDSGVLNILELKSRSRRLSRQMERKGAKLSLIVVDYLQLLTAPTSKERDNRAQEVAEISRGLKALAKELNVPVLALSQLNRNIATKDGRGREPQLSDLRESGAIEQDADIVIFLHEEKNEEQEYGAPPEEGTPVRLILGKHRNGPVGRIDLQFHKQFSRFAEVARGGDSGRAESDF